MADKKAYSKQYYLNNREKLKEQSKQYYLNNAEKVAEYGKTENGKKLNRITNWKHRGVITDDFDELYEKYINTNNCEECNVELIHGMFGSNKKCLDHNHKTGQFRNILCQGCNLRRR
tara:strand:+ start:132 stop:482 length:351 start_codon:yes stop_codon:yes gene_type:complete